MSPVRRSPASITPRRTLSVRYSLKAAGVHTQMAAPKQWLWQVMFGPHRMLTERGDSGRQSVRHFEDEQSAREFARRMVQAGHTVQAGTKPGVEPAKKVLPAEV